MPKNLYSCWNCGKQFSIRRHKRCSCGAKIKEKPKKYIGVS